MKRIKAHPILASACLAILLGAVISFPTMVANLGYVAIRFYLIYTLLIGAFIIYPIILTVINFVSLFFVPKEEKTRKNSKLFEYITILMGGCYSILMMMLTDIVFYADWQETLYNSQMHSPIWTQSYPTVVVLAVVSAAGYLILSWIPLKKMSPLVIVLAIAAMYLGVTESVLWIVQLWGKLYLEDALLCLFPFNCIMIVIKTIRYKIAEWNAIEEHKAVDYEGKPVLAFLTEKLNQAAYWPLLALILMWPLLGIILCILVLFGQKPDYVIKAWTETADWNLSKQIAPQNVMQDEHYLCTVAAGGHRRIVKPIRMGERHGHRVVVNRQLCIANAFEQILEERTPRFHKCVRHFYDTYGFPVARLIRSRYTADVVYFIMKPLEWIFLIVLYLCDVNPENRIAVQYLPRHS